MSQIDHTYISLVAEQGEGGWSHIKISGQGDIEAVRKIAPFLDDHSLAVLCADDTRPRSEDLGNAHLIILRAVNMNPGAEADDMVSLRIWYDGFNVVSIVRREVFAIKRLLKSFQEKKGDVSSHTLVVRILANVVDNMREPLANFFELIDDLELNSMETDHLAQQQKLKELRYSVLIFRRYIAPMKAVVSELETIAEDWEDLALVRQVGYAKDNITRHLEDIDVARDRLQYQQEEILTAITNRLNHNMYRLSIITALFLPLGFITGLLGVNVAGIPGADVPQAFLWVVGGCALLIFAQIIYFKKNSWL